MTREEMLEIAVVQLLDELRKRDGELLDGKFETVLHDEHVNLHMTITGKKHEVGGPYQAVDIDFKYTYPVIAGGKFKHKA